MREIFKMVVGSGSYILNSGEYIEPELQSNQALRIRSGILMHHGGIAEVKQNTYDEVTIGNGTQGMKRIDLVVARYTKDPETEHETMTWVAIQGTPAASDPVAPAYTEGDMQNGDLTDDCPVFEVHLDGIQVTEVVKLVEILDCDLSSLNGKSIKYSVQKIYAGLGVGANTMLRQKVISKSDMDSMLKQKGATQFIGFCTLDGGYADQMQVTFSLYAGELYCQVDNRFASELRIFPSVCMLMI